MDVKRGLLMVAFILVAQTIPDPLSGGAGWAGCGLLGAVLAWLLFVHLPAKDKQLALILETKDKQIGSIMATQDLDRERERTDRHDRANAFQKVLNDMAKTSFEQIRTIQAEHAIDADKDRAAFMQRSENVKLAIEKQTLELQRSIGTSCRYIPPMPMPTPFIDPRIRENG